MDDLLARTDIDGVIIALPILNQPAYIRKALSAGKHVFSEKPITENTREAKELLEWYKSKMDPKKSSWAVAENNRFLPSYNEATKAREQMGKLLQFRLRRSALVEGGKYYETG